MNQQQLQNARAALWRQNAASSGDEAPALASLSLATFDDAVAWLNDFGLALFLPRTAQLPTPAPSFVEATLGAPNPTPSLATVASAMELAARLVAAKSAVALNLMGTFTEQPDFLVSREVLPWVIAIRADRQWKTAPAGRTSPIVVRTWEILNRQGGRTAAEIRQELGREVTEAAVLRALIELWTTMRAVPTYVPAEPTIWNLLQDHYEPELKRASNTAQATAISALLSLYIRSAIAATAEEAEIFLSPLTARSRIREVLHGMTAARSFGTMSLGSHTLLFLPGTLPDFPPEPESETPPAEAPVNQPPRLDRAPFRRPGATRPPMRQERAPGREPRREFQPAAKTVSGTEAPNREEKRPFDRRAPKREWQPGESRPAARPFGPKKFGAGKFEKEKTGGGKFGAGRFGAKKFAPKKFAPRREAGEGAGEERRERPEQRGSRPAQRGAGMGQRNAKPWQKRGPAKFGEKPDRAGRAFTGDRERPKRAWIEKQGPASGEKRREERPWQKRGPRAETPARFSDRERRPRQDAAPGEERPRFAGKPASGRKPPFAGKPSFGRKPSSPGRPAGGFAGKRFAKPGESRPRRTEGDRERPPREGTGNRPAGRRDFRAKPFERGGRNERPGKPGGKPGRPAGRGFGAQSGRTSRPGPKSRSPRKEESPE
ncbi:MAG: hypothetical protein ACLGP3_01405 [Acidobacteriota bacterium]